MFSNDFLKEIPKTDLHLHLDGSLRIPTLIELAKKEKVEMPSYTEEGLNELVFKEQYKDLPDYLHGFKYTCAILRNPENLERCAYELAIDNQNEGVKYIEVRFAPQLHIHKDLDMETILSSVNKGLEKAKKEFNNRAEVKSEEEPPFEYGIITCAMRMCNEHFSPYYKDFFTIHKYSDEKETIALASLELAKAVVKIRDELGIPIVGFDLAGREEGYPGHEHIEAYNYVHKNFMQKTVHAGEAYGAESIFDSINYLHADRLGHGYYLFNDERIMDPEIKDKKRFVEDLASFVADKRVTIEVCLTSNLQTHPELKSIKDHSFGKMIESRLSTTICTDNRLVSKTSVTKELRLAIDNFNITPDYLKNLIVYGFKRSFYPGLYHEKRQYVRKVMKFYEKIAQKYDIK